MHERNLNKSWYYQYEFVSIKKGWIFWRITTCYCTKNDIKRFAFTTYLIKIQTENVLKTMTITDETTRDIVRFLRGFPPNICCCEVTYTSSLYWETEEKSTEGLSVEIKTYKVCSYVLPFDSLVYLLYIQNLETMLFDQWNMWNSLYI